ncbi:MAG: CxxxxCH/CxxCH domain-containing protein [Nitrospirae bacterium]|nr:CxxxxCH/CxxCH domain-containing protein [Nitrospirota bacterium]
MSNARSRRSGLTVKAFIAVVFLVALIQPFKAIAWNDSYLIHNSNRFGTCSNATYSGTSQADCEDPAKGNGVWTPTAKWSGNWGTDTGQYGGFSCETCHVRPSPNIKLFQPVISSPNYPANMFPCETAQQQGCSTSFQKTTNGDSEFGDDSNTHASSTRPCEVCHSLTRFHRFNATGQTEFIHYNKADCISCHSHGRGFKPIGCDGCHGNPPVEDVVNSQSTGGTKGLAEIPGSTGSTTSGAHGKHASAEGQGYSCEICHYGYPGNMPDSGNHVIDIGFNIFSSGGNGTAYNGQAVVAGYRAHNGTTVTATGAKGMNNLTCSNIYCHGNVQGLSGNGAPTAYGTPVWDSPASVQCGSCHKSNGTLGDGSRMDSGSHGKHLSQPGYSCSTCHNGAGSGTAKHADNVIDVSFPAIYGGSASYNGNGFDDHSPGSGYGTCTNIYCHSNAAPFDKANIFRTQNWGDPARTCSSCHDTGGATTGLSGRHAAHTNAGTYGFACEKCHSATASGSSAIKAGAPHSDTAKDVVFSRGGSYSTGSRGCSGTYCHSDARGGSPNQAVAWSDTVALNCDSCHKGRTNIDTLVMSSNGHERLAGLSWVRKYPCYYCHDNTVDLSGNIKDYSKHVNEFADVAINSRWSIVGNMPPSFNSSSKVCNNIYCHSDGTTVNPEVRPFAWTQGRTSCNTCHGHPAGTCSQENCHTDGRTGWAAGQEWKSAMPMYTNTGPGTERANSHPRHLLTNFTCENCHDATIRNGACTECHVNGLPAGTMDEVSHINPDYHVNKAKDVVFKNGGSYSYATKKCSNTVCHTGADPQWGDSVGGQVICLTCHGTTELDVDDFAKFNGTRAKINMNEWVQSGHGRTSASGNYSSGNPPANFPGNPCWYCHDNNILHNDTTNPFRLKQHSQFEARFEKECVYCHMQGIDTECLGCHNAAGSLAPQLGAINNPPFSQEHAGYADGLTSCVSVCHATDAQRHKTGAGSWSVEQKNDVKNQYVMMGVCLKCHDDDRNNRCNLCHTGSQYVLGYDPGTGFISASVSKATSVHFGYKHYGQYLQQGVWKGGKFCWDCHDPHGDSNIYMIQKKVATQTDGTFGIPDQRADVTFTRKQSGLDYARTSAPYDGICNVCHTEMGQHYRFDYGDGHNTGRICTTCHEHRFSDSHASGKSCTECHLNKPIPRHSGFGLPRDCTKCHNGVIKKRMDIMGQFRSNSHHVQGVDTTNKHCYACHWEATENGLINVDYHAGYNYITHTTTTEAPVDLVIWGPGQRPTSYQTGTTAVTFTANKIGTADERTEVGKVTQVCLGCHSDQNNDFQPFKIVDPDHGDCKTPRQYAWDRTSVAARYSQTATATWGKYTTIDAAAKKNITKAFSAHGNAVANQGGWDATNGVDETITNTRNGTQNVQCYDCHSSHGSKATGVTSSYVTFNGTYNGANLKETQAGKGGYQMTYKPSANADTGSVNPYAAGAGLCFDCHDTQTSGTRPWGYNSTFGASQPIRGYKDTAAFGQGTKASTSRFSYRNNSRPILGGHLKASSALTSPAMGTINGLCTPCHDPHGVTPTLGSDAAYAMPLLKGTWLTTPYKDDFPSGASTYYRYSTPALNWHTDRNTFNGSRIYESEEQFAGLCLKCHPKANLTDGINKNSAWKSKDRIHESVKGWGTNAEHSWPCAKCHQPHNSALPRLMQTNCLDYSHKGQVVSGGYPGSYGSYQYPRGKNSTWACHESSSASGSSIWPGNQKWNSVTPW